MQNKIYETKISNFGSGISDSPREPSINKFQITKHFDIFTDPYRLIPYRSMEAEAEGEFKQNGIGNFLYSSNNYLLGLGKKYGSNYPQVYQKSGATLATDNWAAFVNGQGTTGSITDFNLFIEHLDKYYFWVGTKLIQGDITMAAPLSENYQDVSVKSNSAQGLVHSINGILYIPYDNKIASINTVSAWNANAAPALDADSIITSICEFGSYLAIACQRGGGIFNSKVFIWDMVATTFVDIIDWGDEALTILNNLDGLLIGISTIGNSALALDFSKKRVVIKQSSGGKPQVIKEIYPDPFTTSGNFNIYQRVNFIYKNRLYFSVNINAVIGGKSRCGLFVIGRKNNNYNYSVTLDRFATNDNSEDGIRAAIIVGDVCWTVHTANGTVTRSDDTAVYSATSIYESQKFNLSDSSVVKNLLEASITHDKLPAGATVALKYRVDGASSWTAYLTSSTDDRLSEFLNKVIGDYKEIEWRIESYGGAVITGFSFTEEIIGKKKQ